MDAKQKKLIKKGLVIIVQLEHEELEQFNKLVKETLADVEKTRKELRVEESIKINLHFIHYKLKQIHHHVQEIINLAKGENPESDENTIELGHRIKSILKELVELDDEFLPPIKKNLAILSKSEKKKNKFVEQIEKELSCYKNVIDKLKLIFDITELPAEEIKELGKVKVHKIKAKVKK